MWIFYLHFRLLSWYLGCVHVLAIMHFAAMNIHIQVSVWICVFNSLKYMLRSKLSGSYSNSMLSFLRTCQTVFRNSYTISIPTSNLWEFQLLHILTHTCYSLCFYLSHPSGYEVISHCGLICISLVTNHVCMVLVLYFEPSLGLQKMFKNTIGVKFWTLYSIPFLYLSPHVS